MRKQAILIFGLFWLSTAHAATNYYFDNTVSNYTTCSQASPCTDFPGTTLDTTNQLACGDTLNFKRGQIDTGSAAHIVIQSGTSACSGNPIVVQSYGTGANHIFAADGVYGGTWTLASGSIYYTDTGSTNPKGYVLEDDDTGLHIWSVANNTVPAGAFCPSASTTAGTVCNTTGPYVFVRRTDSADPTSTTMRIGDFVVGDTSRGLFKGPTGANRGTYGHYIDVKDIQIYGSSGMGISPNGPNWRTLGLHVLGARKDGLCPIEYVTGGEDATGFIDYYSFIEGAAAGGSGFGQGVTVYAGSTTFVGTVSAYNGMAGFDILDYGADVEPDNTTLLRIVSTHNAMSPKSNGFDPLFYNDGGVNLLVWGAKFYDVGLTSNTNSRQCIKVGSEHPADEPISNNNFVNILGSGCHSFGMKTDNLNQGDPDNIEGLNFYWMTLASNAGTAGDRNYHFSNLAAIADTAKIRNSILIGNSGTVLDDAAYTGTSLDMDYNIYYRRSQASSTNLYSGVTACGGGADANCTLTEWRTQTGEDSNSAYGDPLLVSDSATAPDFHLSATSPAFGAAQVDAWDVNSLSWVPSNIKTDIGTHGVRGITASTGAEDTDWNDAGFHYSAGNLTSANIEPASLVASASGNVTISFTMPSYVSALLYNSKLVIVFPTGFTFDQGGTTAFTSSDIDGTFTTSCTGTTCTITRVGDGSSTFPKSVTGTLSNVGNPSAGNPGTYSIYLVEARSFTNYNWNSIERCNGIYDSNVGCIQSQATSIASDTFTANSPATHSTLTTNMTCTGTMIIT